MSRSLAAFAFYRTIHECFMICPSVCTSFWLSVTLEHYVKTPKPIVESFSHRSSLHRAKQNGRRCHVITLVVGLL